MEEVFVVATIITVAFCLTKFIESKYLIDEVKPLKDTVKDCFLVMLCSVGGSYLYFYFQSTIRDFLM